MKKTILSLVATATLFGNDVNPELTTFRAGDRVNVGDVNGNFESLKKGILDLQEVVKTQATQISGLQTTVTNQESKITTLQSEKETLSGKVTSLETSNTALSTKVTSLETENRNLKSQLENNISTLEEKINESPLKFFTAEEKIELWSAKRSNFITTQDVSNYIPETASGVILKVVVRTVTSDKTASFMCADKNGEFGEWSHYKHNGFSNYNNYWVGGLVLCPVKSNKTFNWTNLNETGQIAGKTGDDGVESYGILLGYY
jgi:uncharacterized coiled-coil protein SlyX